MGRKIKYSNEPMSVEVMRDFLPKPEKLADVKRAWLEEVQRRSADFDLGRVKTVPANEVFQRARARLKK